MEQKQNFTLRHTVLYAKNWYKRSDDFWEDIKKCLTADGYCGEFYTPAECAQLILRQIERLPYKSYRNSLASFVRDIQEHEVWKFGYYTNNNCHWISKEQMKGLPQYDLNTAIVKVCLSHFVNLDNEEWAVTKPDFKKCLPKNPDVTMKMVNNQFKDIK